MEVGSFGRASWAGRTTCTALSAKGRGVNSEKSDDAFKAGIASTVRIHSLAFTTRNRNALLLILPIPLLVGFFVGLLSLALLGFGIYLLYRAARGCVRYDLVRRPDFSTHPEGGPEIVAVRHTVTLNQALHNSAILTPLIAAFMLLLLTFAGRHLVKLAFPVGNDEPVATRTGSATEISASDGTKIHVELYGPVDGPTLVFTHG